MLPTQRKSRAASKKGRSHQAIRTSALTTTCPACYRQKMHHAACSHCGYVRKGLTLKVAGAEAEE